MRITAAVIKEQGITFVVIPVKQQVIDSKFRSDEAINAFAPLFPRLSIILMTSYYNGTSKFYGDRKIVAFLSKLPIYCMPWKEYNVYC